ncbi:MAG: hypothetical protein PHC88_15785 [Terrimicrobiaceae bacterium]|nr:hypothetical protein [Terrimicrobiaceae bacterium]
MNRRFLVLSIAIGVLLVAVYWWLTRPAFSPPQSPPVAVAPTLSSQRQSTRSLPYQVPIKGRYQGKSDPRWEWWKRMEEIDPKFDWKMPINFYGKVIDQTGQPVQGAKVRFQWTDMSAAGTTEKITESDARGMFSLANQRGKRLGVYVSKEGYHAMHEGKGSFEYAAFSDPEYIEPDLNNPVIFQLLKKIEAEPLIVGDALKVLSYDRAYYYDLKRGILGRQPPNEAGLKFTFERNQTAQGQHFDWSWKVEGVNAALQVTSDEFPQLAPSEGYVPSWETGQKADAKTFRIQAQVRLYLRSNDNRYGRVDLELTHPNTREYGPILNAKSYFNPSGSRNLEFDPAKAVKSP